MPYATTSTRGIIACAIACHSLADAHTPQHTVRRCHPSFAEPRIDFSRHWLCSIQGPGGGFFAARMRLAPPQHRIITLRARSIITAGLVPLTSSPTLFILLLPAQLVASAHHLSPSTPSTSPAPTAGLIKLAIAASSRPRHGQPPPLAHHDADAASSSGVAVAATAWRAAGPLFFPVASNRVHERGRLAADWYDPPPSL